MDRIKQNERKIKNHSKHATLVSQSLFKHFSWYFTENLTLWLPVQCWAHDNMDLYVSQTDNNISKMVSVSIVSIKKKMLFK